MQLKISSAPSIFSGQIFEVTDDDDEDGVINNPKDNNITISINDDDIQVLPNYITFNSHISINDTVAADFPSEIIAADIIDTSPHTCDILTNGIGGDYSKGDIAVAFVNPANTSISPSNVTNESCSSDCTNDILTVGNTHENLMDPSLFSISDSAMAATESVSSSAIFQNDNNDRIHLNNDSSSSSSNNGSNSNDNDNDNNANYRSVDDDSIVTITADAITHSNIVNLKTTLAAYPPEVENEGRIILRAILQEIIEKSGLISLLDTHLRNESFIEIENHKDLFYLIFQVKK